MTSAEKDLLLRLGPAYLFAAGAYLFATAYGVYAFFQIRKINAQREQSNAEHEARMADMKVSANERVERFLAWRKAQPGVEEVLKKAADEIGSVEDVRRKMNDPNHVWVL